MHQETWPSSRLKTTHGEIMNPSRSTRDRAPCKICSADSGRRRGARTDSRLQVMDGVPSRRCHHRCERSGSRSTRQPQPTAYSQVEGRRAKRQIPEGAPEEIHHKEPSPIGNPQERPAAWVRRTDDIDVWGWKLRTPVRLRPVAGRLVGGRGGSWQLAAARPRTSRASTQNRGHVHRSCCLSQSAGSALP
ncbi:hypothetical protein GY45DRAFT_45570 [Cubamyces sp. BRFM 1775]|nr:hypothetical protein GY45DRAFT_45570 [Cubamyces sp. BRFM 1775]